MSFFSDARETQSLFGGYIEEVQKVLRSDQMDFGTPFDFPILAKALKNDTRLRENLAVLARSIMEREKTISLRTILTIIAIASGGPDLTVSDSDMSRPVNLLIDFLISVGGCSQTSIQNPDTPCSELVDESTRQPVLLTPSSGHEEYSEQSNDADDLSKPEAVPGSSDQYPSLHAAEDPYAESLTRLELSSLQMKHYLDSIDQRISRMEPRLDSLPAYVLPPAMPPPGHAPEERYSAVIAPEILLTQPQNEPLSPQTSSHPGTDSRQIFSGKQFAIPVITSLAAVALVLVSLFYWGFHRNAPSPTIRPVPPTLADNGTTPPSTFAPVTSTAASSLSESAKGIQPQRDAAAATDISTKANNPPSTKPSPIHFSASSRSSNASTSPSPSPAVENTSSDPHAPSPPRLERATLPDSAIRRVNVSSGVMAANVLSAPQPSYPRLASLTRMQGEVIMQAIISKDGTIEDVHVIKGHRLLRGAATNAVRTWRYRPFLIDGHPVEVATIVSVDFKLPR